MKKANRWISLALALAMILSTALSGYTTAYAANVSALPGVEQGAPSTPGSSVIEGEGEESRTPPGGTDSSGSGTDMDASAQTPSAPAEGEEENENPDAEPGGEAGSGIQGEETTPEEVAVLEGEEPYRNYLYGDPDYNGNYVFETLEDGTEVMEHYENDLDTIIAMAEEGMDLSNFFKGTVFKNFTLDTLKNMKAEGYTFAEVLYLITIKSEKMPDWLKSMFSSASPRKAAARMPAAGGRGLPNTLTGQNWVPMSLYRLGVIDCLGGNKNHGFIGKLKASGDDGLMYEVFCLSYGGSFQGGYVYNQAEYSECTAPNGTPLTADQKVMLSALVNSYVNNTMQECFDYSAVQLIMWYIINNVTSFRQIDWQKMYQDILPGNYAIVGNNPGFAQIYLENWCWIVGVMVDELRAGSTIEDMFGEGAVEVFFWRSGAAPTAQNILSWDKASDVQDPGVIPYIDNHYMERTATTRYNVDITKESVITNELLEGIRFEIVESEAAGHDLTYDYIHGEYSEDGQDYENATVLPDSFGNVVIEQDPVPYMDPDIEPSGGAHRTIVTTDKNGHASTTFRHEHTFKEFYSQCYAMPEKEITFEQYEALWERVLQKAQTAGILEIMYMGQMQLMTYDQVLEIYNNQQVVYTQTEEEAANTVNSLYDAYVARTHTYTVTELDSYTRPSASDSNGNILSEITLPKEGYRKDVADATTQNTYSEVVSDGGTMIAGGKNDSDPNTEEVNITNEPWYNQIFINKTDLESQSPILYDTAFDIYEYYRYKVTLKPVAQNLYPAELLKQYMAEAGSVLIPGNIKSASLIVTDASGKEVSHQDVDTAKMVAALADPRSYVLTFNTTYSGEYTVELRFTTDDALDTSSAIKKYVYGGTLEELGACICGDACGDVCEADCPVCSIDPGYAKAFDTDTPVTAYKLFSKEKVEKRVTFVSAAGKTFTTDDGITYTITMEDPAAMLYAYTYTDAQGEEHRLTNSENRASVSQTNPGSEPAEYVFSYEEDYETGITIFSDGVTMKGSDLNHKYVKVEKEQEEGAGEADPATFVLSFYASGSLENGEYSYKAGLSVAASAIHSQEIDYNVKTDPDDYTTWGQDNYEIVRVTPEIAKKMGWSHKTIGMYTVHRLSPTDQYCGTTFTSHHDESDKGTLWGYYEYGTLYYTQANLGKFAIVEKTAPSDGSLTGYLGNYTDREYTNLTDESAQKNNDGAPFATNDQMSVVKDVHYISLCKDTNQYATYMLTDGYKEYDPEKYAFFQETVRDAFGNDVATGDGYDGHYFAQSSLVETIALERFKLEAPFNDVLNSYWDAWFTEYMSRKSGLSVIRNSQKTDAWLEEMMRNEVVHHFVGTTINTDSFDDNDSSQSDIVYDGTYTHTELNYNTYVGERAEALNKREGFNVTDYLQTGSVTYDNGAAEKDARYHATEKDVTKDEGFAFIDEREYGFIRFTKYDRDADRYVDGDLDAGYEAGTDHADADLDGAVYSLYVDESCLFIVDYLEGEKDGRLFWAQPLPMGGYRLIYDGDGNLENGFTDFGTNETEDFPLAYVTEDGVFFYDYMDDEAGSADVVKKSATYHGIQHPDGQYGGAKHNGFFAVQEEQQVFIDLNNDGYSDTWTVEDVTLYAGAKAASAVIENGELQIDGLYLGTYYLAEEIRDAITIYSTDNDDQEYAENRWLSFAAGYTADTDDSGNPVKYTFRFPYVGQTVDGTDYTAEQDYVHKDTNQVSLQKVVRGGSAQFNKQTTNGESSGSGNTTGEALEGAGFKVFLLSELSLIKDGTITPAYSETDGHVLVEGNHLTKLFDNAGNMVGYAFTKGYLKDQDLYAYFDEKYPDGYNLEDVNRLIYVKDRGYFYIEDILAAYKNAYYDNFTKKWDFSGEEDAIARIYSHDTDYIEGINAGYDYVDNHLNQGSPCEYYGVNGLSDGWVPTGVKYEYKLSEIFSNHYGNFRVPELSWGAYLAVETTTPSGMFTADPVFFTITDSSASANRSRKQNITDAPFVASMVLVKRDAQSGQDIKKAGTSYRIWDYKNHQYVSKFLLGENGGLSMVSQRVFTTDDFGRVDAVASLESGKYRIEELSGPHGTHNVYWDYGNSTKNERLGGIGADDKVPVEDNMFQKYYGTKDFEVTTERRYKSSGVVSSDNLDYVYIGEIYYNDEIQGRLNITKTGEVLVGYRNTDDIEYADEFTPAGDRDFNYSKTMLREREIFNAIKDHYDLGTDEITYKDVVLDNLSVESIIPVSHIAVDAAGMELAAIYTSADGELITMNGGHVYVAGVLHTDKAGERTVYAGAALKEIEGLYCCILKDSDSYIAVLKKEEADPATGELIISYTTPEGEEITDSEVIASLIPAVEVEKADGGKLYLPADETTAISETDGYVMITYDLITDVYESAGLRTAEDLYLYSVHGEIMDTSYLVKDTDGVLTTNDHGVLTQNADGTYKLTYSEAIYDPDINYSYTLTLSDGREIALKMVTGSTYLTGEGTLVTVNQGGTITMEDEDGKLTTFEDAAITLNEKNTGNTFDFVYEERPLAGATYVVKAAEDIVTQDGGDNYWFKKGDVVATVTTGNQGEIVSFAPAYNQGGQFDSAYYYGSKDGMSTSLIKSNGYAASEFATTGAVKNEWIASRMSPLDLALYGIPAFTDDTIYPNTFYREEVQPIYRRIIKEGVSTDTIATDYQTRLEAHDGLDSEGCAVLTETKDGFMLTHKESVDYKGASLKENADYFILEGRGRSGEAIDIEVRVDENLFLVTECLDGSLPFSAGDKVRRTASGYELTHTAVSAAGVSNGATVDGAADLGFTTTATYKNGVLYDNGDGIYTLYDENLREIAKVQGNVLVTEAGGIVTKTDSGFRVDYEKAEAVTSNKYVIPSLTVKGAALVIKDQKYELSWDSASQTFKTIHDTAVAFAPDYQSITVTTGGEERTYQAFDLLVEYEFHYAAKENIVSVSKDGTLGMVSLNLPLGVYSVEEIKTPYGFLINEQVQTVRFEAADQVKEIVFNTASKSNEYTDKTMDIWKSKGLKWFVGGLNTIGEKLNQMMNVNFFTWGTYGDGELPFFKDKEGFINFFDLRVKAWSQEDVPEKPEGDKIIISKKDITTYEELPGAHMTLTDETENVVDDWISSERPHFVFGLKDGVYTLTEVTAPDGYDVAESITFTVKDGKATGTIVMYDAPSKKGVTISKQDITNKKELPGAHMVVTDEFGKAADSWVSTKKPHVIENLPDGKYTLTEITAPDGYEVSESITFTVKDGVAFGGDVVMYDAPSDGKFYISKQDVAAKEELPGAHLTIVDENGKTVDNWISGDAPHVMEGLKDGTYTLTEVIAPDGYEKAESITFRVDDGKVVGGPVVMYDRKEDSPEEPGDDRHPDSEENQWKLGVGIYKADTETKESLRGAKFGLYTSDDIYNVDGKLIVARDTLLAVATTDKTGHANFAVDIALMSKDLDADRADHDTVYEKTISYTYDTLTPVTGSVYKLSVSDCDDILIAKQPDGTFKTETGSILTINEAEKTVTYTVKEAIDGNTAVNTGKFHIKELTPPEGYLYDDTVYDVKFEYDDEYTMYIPVYAKHDNEPAEVALTKKDITGKEEIPGTEIAVYKIKDIYDTNADGLISHADENLTLLDTWISTDTAHVVSGLYLSNTEWPRLPNEEERENIYIFRELVPAPGYVRAHDIEFKLYQNTGESGWVDPGTGRPYGYEVLVRTVTCDQKYESGSIISANEHADDWVREGKKESDWDYTTTLPAETEIKWLLVNDNLVLFFHKDITVATVSKILKEEDFEDLTFKTVSFEFGGRPFDVDFFTDKQVDTRPDDSYLHFDQHWYTLDDYHVTMYDETTKLTFSKSDITTGADVIGAHMEIRDETGTLMDSWIVEDDGTGKAKVHYLEGILEVDKTYTLTETLAPTENGYVKSNSITFTVDNEGHIQKVVMMDDYTKLLISKADITTRKEIDGAYMELWSADKNFKKLNLMDSWVTGSDGYDKNGKPNQHYMEYLPVGNYVLVEKMAPQGYLTAEDVPFTVTETGIIQHVQMLDATTNLKIYKYRTGTQTFVPGATIQIYEVPEEYVKYLSDRFDVETDAGFVDTDEEPDFVETPDVLGSKDLADYLTAVKAADTEHRKTYQTKLTLDYSIRKEDLADGLIFRQQLPKEFGISDSEIGVEYVVRDNGEDAFTFTFGKNQDGNTLIVTFDEAYAAASAHELYNFHVTFDATISDSALKGGSLVVDVKDGLILRIPKEEIKEIDSSLTEAPVTIKLTEKDLRATVTTQNGPVSVPGLTQGWYIALETKAPNGYILDKTPQVFKITSTTTEQALTFYNQAMKEPDKPSGGGSHTPKPGKPTIGKLVLKFGSGWNWNNVRTEDNGEDGSSVILSIENENHASKMVILGIVLVAAAISCGVAVVVISRKKKREEESQ